jgi:hypothetical protein
MQRKSFEFSNGPRDIFDAMSAHGQQGGAEGGSLVLATLEAQARWEHIPSQSVLNPEVLRYPVATHQKSWRRP